MEVIINSTDKEASRLGARIIAHILKKKPAAVLGLATGSTPLGVYQELIELHQKEKLSFRHALSFNLDEYVGLAPSHPASYSHFMQENFFRHININKKKTFIPNGLSKDIPKTCKKYEQQIKKSGGIDIQLLGIGTDGHIAFNEPTSSLTSRTRIKTLTEQTREDNKKYFTNPNDIPRHVITMGIGTIMESKVCLLLAFGAKKAEIVAKMIEGPITSMVPASILQMHPSTIILLDEAAASKLTRINYYQEVYNNKPKWQKYE